MELKKNTYCLAILKVLDVWTIEFLRVCAAAFFWTVDNCVLHVDRYFCMVLMAMDNLRSRTVS